jgi:hypothetical protein
MSRPKKKAVFLPTRVIHHLRSAFLSFAVLNNSGTLRRLFFEVSAGQLSVSQWAAAIDQSGTWLEHWAASTIEAWDAGRLPKPAVVDGQDCVYYPAPADSQTRDPLFLGIITGVPKSRLSSGISTSAAKWWTDDTPDDRDVFRKEMHAKLDSQLDHFFEKAICSGNASEYKLPSNLQMKLEAAALYFLCDKDRPEIAAEMNASAATIYDWLIEVQSFLKLRMKKPGHRDKGSDIW